MTEANHYTQKDSTGRRWKSTLTANPDRGKTPSFGTMLVFLRYDVLIGSYRLLVGTRTLPTHLFYTRCEIFVLPLVIDCRGRFPFTSRAVNKNYKRRGEKRGSCLEKNVDRCAIGRNLQMFRSHEVYLRESTKLLRRASSIPCLEEGCTVRYTTRYEQSASGCRGGLRTRRSFIGCA